MLFSSLIFLYIFLPISFLLVLISGKKLNNSVLSVLSIFFCAWGGVSYTIIILCSIILNYIFGLLIDKTAGTPGSKYLLFIGIVINVCLLVVFKYWDFVVTNYNLSIGGAIGIHDSVKSVALPLAISYYTFHAISYLLDIFWQKAKVLKNIIDLTLYITFFPKLVAGPIVRFSIFEEQISNHKISFEKFASGVERFALGFGKKILLANTFAYVADKMFALPVNEHSFYTAWLGIITYTLQLYYDFSGYSDMAIGVAKMFGFTIPENFNFPYISKSIQEFWQRWHMTLSAWLREYLFSPLAIKFRNGGKIGIVISLLITFGICGLWHGPKWTFVFWGLIHGIFLALESAGFSKTLKKVWSPFRHIYVILVVLFSWVLFRSDTFEYALGFMNAMIGLGNAKNNLAIISFFFNSEFQCCLAIGIIATTRFFPFMQNILSEIIEKFPAYFRNIINSCILAGEMIGIVLVMFCSTMYMVTTTYNPFIYFRF